MTSEAPRDHFRGPVEMVETARVARLHYLDHRSKTAIATELGMSRFKVARLIELARASGMVRITVVGEGTVDVELSSALRDRFGLRHVVVANTARGSDREIREQLGEVSARLIEEICSPEDVLGIGWARVVLATVSRLSEIRLHRVVQLTGALTRPDVEPSSVEVVREVALLAGARSSVFFAPMVVSDELTARGLRRQDQVAGAITHFDEVTKAVVGVGGWDPPHSTLHDALSEPEREVLRAAGVQADLSGVLLDAEGTAVDTPLNTRIIGISAQQLRGVPDVIGIAYGTPKVPAALSAIRGGYLNGLVTHTEFARELLALDLRRSAARA